MAARASAAVARTLRTELGFAANVTAVQVVTFSARNVDRVLVGIVAGPAAVGLYTQASQLLVLPSTSRRWPCSAWPSRCSHGLRFDRARFIRAYRRTAAL